MLTGAPALGPKVTHRGSHCVAQADLMELKLSEETFGTKFDVVLVDPPWQEYVRRAPGAGPDAGWNWQAIKALEIEAITAVPSFVFLWCGLPALPHHTYTHTPSVAALVSPAIHVDGPSGGLSGRAARGIMTRFSPFETSENKLPPFPPHA